VTQRIFNEQNLVGDIYVVLAAPFALIPLLAAGLAPGPVVLVSVALFFLLFGIRGFLFLLHSRRLAAFELRHAGIRLLAEEPWRFNPFGVAEPIVRRRAAVSQFLCGLFTIFATVFVVLR
jgi:hypothetical protein